MSDTDVVVLGGGAAGLFCALTAGRRGLRVRVLEHASRVGKKILMSGGGRCNFTNLRVGPEHFLSANPHFCKSALARYTPVQFIALVEKHGIAYHEKELGQLFCDDSSKQVVKLLLDECATAGVRIDVNCEIGRVEPVDRGFVVRTSLGEVRARKLVVATGGLSVPTMGATGFGYSLARQFGHALQPTRAGLVPLTLSGRPLEEWQDLAGVSLQVEASVGGVGFRNAMLMTHRGISGPAILQISSYWDPPSRPWGAPTQNQSGLRIDLMPGVDALAFLLEKQRAQREAELRTVLAEIWPKRFAQRFCEVLTPSQPMKRYTRDELRVIAEKIRDWPIRPSGTEGYRTAEVTLGGVDTDGISSSTFESRRQPGLHFIGEVLDVTGWLGGYNFQWAWASAHACGQAL